MLVTRLDVPQGTRLSFQPRLGPLQLIDDFHDLGLVVLAEQHAESSADSSGQLQDNRMVLDCEGVEASYLFQQLKWPKGESTMDGTVRFGSQMYPVALQVRARPHGLRAILRVVE
jgi:hypothetical protein